MKSKKVFSSLLLMCMLGAVACSGSKPVAPTGPSAEEPASAPAQTEASQPLLELEPPNQPVKVTIASFSSEVSGKSGTFAHSGRDILAQALERAGKGKWFEVLEPGVFISAMKEGVVPGQSRPPGVALHAKILEYNESTDQGGEESRILKLAEDEEYHRDKFRIEVRAADAFDGSVLLSKQVSETLIWSPDDDNNYRFAILDKDGNRLEEGVGQIDTEGLLVQRTAELAVHDMVAEGLKAGLWQNSLKVVRASQNIPAVKAESKPAATSKKVTQVSQKAVSKKSKQSEKVVPVRFATLKSKSASTPVSTRGRALQGKTSPEVFRQLESELEKITRDLGKELPSTKVSHSTSSGTGSTTPATDSGSKLDKMAAARAAMARLAQKRVQGNSVTASAASSRVVTRVAPKVSLPIATLKTGWYVRVKSVSTLNDADVALITSLRKAGLKTTVSGREILVGPYSKKEKLQSLATNSGYDLFYKK